MTMARVQDNRVVAVGLPATLQGRPRRELNQLGWRLVKGTPRPANHDPGMTYVYQRPYTYNADEDAVYGQWVQIDLAAQQLAEERARMKVTRRQAKQQLASVGLLDQVQAAINGIGDAEQKIQVQIYWDDSLYLERLHPELIALGTELGLDGDQMDDLFRSAAER